MPPDCKAREKACLGITFIGHVDHSHFESRNRKYSMPEIVKFGYPTFPPPCADQHRSPHRGSPVAGRASLKRKASVPEALAPSPPTLAASTMTDLITRGIDKFVELEHKRMRLELDLLERLRHEEMERVERMRREEMEHELRLMTVIASLFNNNNSASSVNLNSSSSTSAGTQPPSGDTS